MESRVVRVEVEASVDSVGDLEVNEAVITLGVNAIPRVELHCVPSRRGGKTVNVSAPKLTDYIGLYKQLQEAAEGLNTTASATFRTFSEDAEIPPDELSLSNWILSDVGMSSVGATSAPYLTVVMQHPICKLTKVGSVYESPKNNMARNIDSIFQSGYKYLTVVDKLYSYIASPDSDSMYWPSRNKYASVYRKALGQDEFKPGKYLRDDTPGTFLGKYVNPTRMAQAEWRIALPVEGGTSTWDMLMASTGHMLLSITQDESSNFTGDKLVLEPARPWKESSISLDDDWCTSTDIPGPDPFKIAGVMARKLGPFSDAVTLGIWRNGNPNDGTPPAGEIMYVPNPPQDPKLADGRIMKTSSPALLEMAFRSDAPYGGTITTSNILDVSDRMLNYDEALKAYCKAVYEMSALSLSRATARMALRFRDMSQRLILPGNTCCFYVGGEEIYYGYVQKVVHNMSTMGGCGTSVMMSHVRATPDYKIKGQTAISAGSPNAAWE